MKALTNTRWHFRRRTKELRFWRNGFTLIETLIGLGILLIVLTAVWALFHAGINAIGSARAKSTAISVANEQIEIIHNLPYQSVGTTTGWPLGVLPPTSSIERNGFAFSISIRAKYVDDPYDGNAFGTIPGKPSDTQPSDYKLVEVSVCWSQYPCPTPMRLTSNIVPKGVESSPGTGTLALQVLDASGGPVREANVVVTNALTVPAINISNTTDSAGNLLLPSLPPAQDSYHVVVTKTGYSDDFTITPSSQNPQPTRPDTSVVADQVTPLTFFIDKLAEITLVTVNSSCLVQPDISFRLHGDYLDGTDPDVYRYSADLTTGATGQLTISNLRWDNYTLAIDPSEAVDISGTTINQPFNILPGSDQVVYIHLSPNEPNSLLTSIRESGNHTPLSGATVKVEDGLGYDQTITTGQGTVSQIDWSGGSGQVDYTDPTRYASQDGNIDTADNQLALVRDQAVSDFVESFDSDFYADYGSTTADWNTTSALVRLADNGSSFDSSGIAQSLSVNSGPGIITEATLNSAEQLNGQTIAYALSADGGNTFEPVQPGITHTFVSPGSDLRWQATLNTTDPSVSPELDSVSLEYVRLVYRSQGELISSTMDLGADTNFDSLIWSPTTQPPETGVSSLEFQVATNTDQTTWNFVGPDGTSSTSYDTSADTLWSGHAGDRYFRYKIRLKTGDPTFSPTLASVSIVHSAGCIPPGQAFFSPLDAADYQVTVDRPGYSQYLQSYHVSGDTSVIIDLDPS